MPSLNPNVTNFLSGVNRDFPGRKKDSDGTWGDAAHQARKSDHNTGDAVDITVDPNHGVNGDDIAARALRDPNVKYVIWNHRIYNTARPGWRDYHGANPHTKHVHVSFKRTSNVAQGDPHPASAKAAKPRRRKRRSIHGRHIPHRRSKGGTNAGTGSKGSRGKNIVQGERTVVLGTSQLMAAHVQTPHTGGGKIKEGSTSVFVGSMQLALARKGDPTTDNYKVKTGHDFIESA